MRTNQPYVKRYDQNGVLTNPITKDKPYLHPFRSVKDQEQALKYITFHNPITGEFACKRKINGNNRRVASATKRRKGITKRVPH